MGDLAVGDRVVCRDVGGLIAVERKKLERRVGTVDLLFTPQGGRELLARVVFDARRKGSPTYTVVWTARWFKAAEGSEPAQVRGG